MSYNKYNTRQSGRFNTPCHFIPAQEQTQQQQGYTPMRKPYSVQNQHQQQQHQPKQFQPPQPAQNIQTIQNEVEMKSEPNALNTDEEAARPSWMKSKLPGVKKISNKERRRRQNAHLRRLLTPKNALMALNELLLNEQIPNEFKVEPTATKQFYNQPTSNFCADLTVEGNVYKGYGETKLTARNAAAEQAIRDIMIKKMSKILNSDGSLNGEAATDEEAVPMIQLASFALHKLFTEWECEGHKVPQLKPAPAPPEGDELEAAGAGAGAGAGAAAEARQKKKAKPRVLPLNAANMHPCMLLTYMRPQQEYRELGVAGDRPQNMIFTVGVHVDGEVYTGKAPNKKEARKAAARAACAALFGVTFSEHAADTTPQLPPQAAA
ncbi:uncharacterized protein LOC115447541 isoform X2 [Manduca sexta]|uniref:uncharacterized protein LOC115447541 isoform X2 n=1 Tax=Manduca sexta TaxID=7130 RepID=UPI00188F2227|nr:uncharacterized protein LOC115447541 isoform X2 [Manduca sexta]